MPVHPAEPQFCPAQILVSTTHCCFTCASYYSYCCYNSISHEVCMTTFWQLALNQSPFCRLLSACCFWPTALLSHGFLPLPSMLAVVSENYPHFSLLWDYGPVYWLAAAGHMLSSLVRCSFPHTDYSSGPREVKGCLPACRNTKNSSSNDNTLSQSM